MKKTVLMLAFSFIGFAAHAQCSKSCGGGTASGCDKKKETASVTTSTNDKVATDNKNATTKSTSVANKKRRKAKNKTDSYFYSAKNYDTEEIDDSKNKNHKEKLQTSKSNNDKKSLYLFQATFSSFFLRRIMKHISTIMVLFE